MNSMNILSGAVGLSKYFGCVSPVYYMLRPIDKLNDVRYFNYIFQTKKFQRSLYGLGNGILIKESSNGTLNTIRMRITMDKFGNLFIPLAKYKEQQRIADFLDKKCSEIDNLIENIKNQIVTLEQYKKSIITEAVTKGLDKNAEMKDSGIDYLGSINSAWRLTKIRYCCKKLERPVELQHEPLICSNKGKVLKRGEGTIGLMSDDDKMFQGVEKGDLLIHGMDTWHGAVAISNYVGKCTTVVHVCESEQSKSFISYYLQMYAFKKVYKAISSGVRENTSDFRSWIKMGNVYIVLPNLEIKNKIANYIDEKCLQIDETIYKKQQQIETLEEYKKTVIFEYVTGKKEIAYE